MLPVPRLRAPIVLVHGILGFDRLRLGPLTLFEYFRHIPAALRSGGNRVLVPRLSPTGSVAERAAQLKAWLDRDVPHEAVHLFGHSMGGLDSRYLISRLGMASRVLTLTSIGTPHCGSPFADWGIQRFARFVRPLCDYFGVSYQGFYDLTTTSCRRFNKEVQNVDGVRYFSIAGRLQLSWRTPNWWLPGRVVERTEGPNDGVVSLASARWGEDFQVWDGDHVELVNWPRPLASHSRSDERIAAYINLVRRLADLGY